MRPMLFLLALLLVLLAACGGQPPADPQVNQIEVEVTRLVETQVEVTRLVETQVEVTRLVEIVVTATPLPSPVPSPTTEIDPTIYIVGANITPDDLPPGDPGLVVVTAGPPNKFGNIPVVVRNNTDSPIYNLQISATARDAAGSVLGTGSGSDLVPIYVPPGGIAIGGVYIRDTPLDGAEIEYLVTGEADPGSIYTRHSLEVVEHNLVGGNIAGSLLNSSNSTLDFVNISVVCLDDTATPTIFRDNYADQDIVEAAAQIPFSVDLFGDQAQCTRYLLAARGAETD